MLSKFFVAQGSVDVNVQLTLAPPENFTVTSLTNDSVEVTWDKSPASDYGHVDAYAVYNKSVIDVTYPLMPTLTRYDILDSYTDTISGLDPSVGHDFIVYALTVDSAKSPFDCESCKGSIEATYIPTEDISVITGGGGYSSINIAQRTTANRLFSLKQDSTHSSAKSSSGGISVMFLRLDTVEEITSWPVWNISGIENTFSFLRLDTVEEITSWPVWQINN